MQGWHIQGDKFLDLARFIWGSQRIDRKVSAAGLECETVQELLAPLGTIEDWASRALDEAEKARLAGDRFTEIERMYIFGEIVSCGEVSFHRNA